MKALGMIETKGMLGSIVAADTALKTSNVTLINIHIIKGGLVSIEFVGDVGAVKVAVEYGVQAVKEMGVYLNSLVIARPDNEIDVLLKVKGKESQINEEIKEATSKDETIENDLKKEVAEIDLKDQVIEVDLKEEPIEDEFFELESTKGIVLENSAEKIGENELKEKIKLEENINLKKETTTTKNKEKTTKRVNKKK